MATLKICVRSKRSDGFYPVYIRVTHHRELAYIKTDKMVNDKGITKTKEVKDPYVVGLLSPVIIEYMERLNKKDIRNWNAWKSHTNLTHAGKYFRPSKTIYY